MFAPSHTIYPFNELMPDKINEQFSWLLWLKCHFNPKLTNSAEISNSLAIMNIDRNLWLSFYPKKLIKYQLFKMSIWPRKEHWKRKTFTLCVTKWDFSHLNDTGSDSAYYLDLQDTPAAAGSLRSTLAPVRALQPFSKVGAASRLHLIYI